MKTNELRIGNYLNGKQGHVTVTEIRKNNIVKIQDNTSSFYVGTCLKPITLTREWLIKFKFEELEKDCRTFFKKGKFKVELSNGGNVYYNRNIFISSVHQLQNLYFALTREELTFKSE